MSSAFSNPEASSSDDFEQLRSNLPSFPSSLPNQHCQNSREYDVQHQPDDFIKWQLARFNRSGFPKVFDMICMSFSVARRHFLYSLLYSPIYLLCYFVAISRNPFLFVPIHSLASMVSAAISFSATLNEKQTQKLRDLLSVHGLAEFMLQLVRSLSVLVTLRRYLNKEPYCALYAIMCVATQYCMFYHPCFVFDSKDIGVITALCFSFRISFRSAPANQAFKTFLICFILQILGPVTFGFTASMGGILRCLEFLAICGSGKCTDISQTPVSINTV